MTLLALCLLASCSDEKTSIDVNSSKDGTFAEETLPDSNDNPIKQQDFAEAEFRIAAFIAQDPVWRAYSYCEMFTEAEDGDPINDAIYQRNRAVEERLGIKLSCYQIASTNRNISDKLRTHILSADDVFDAAMITGNGVSTMIGSGDMIVDLSSISTLDLENPWWDQTSRRSLEIYGKNYIITGDISLFASFSSVMFFVNKKIVENLKLDPPYELVRTGKWTLDVSMEMMKQASRDLDGDGKRTEADSWGMCGQSSSVFKIMTAAGVRLSMPDGEGGHKITINTNKTSELVEKLVPFIKNSDYVTTAENYSGYNNVFAELFVPMFMDDRVLFYNNQLVIMLNLRDMEADFGVLPSPKYDETQDDYIGTVSSSQVTFLIVPTTNSNLDFTGTVLDAMGYYSREIIKPAFIDVTVRNKTLRDEDSAEMLELILSCRSYDLAEYYAWGGVSTFLTKMAGNKSINFASEYAAIEANVIAAMEKTLAEIKG